jgi:hypothetical protein
MGVSTLLTWPFKTLLCASTSQPSKVTKSNTWKHAHKLKYIHL